MRLAPERCSLVLLGAWNRAIFTPDWVSERLFEPRESTVRLGAPPGLRHLSELVELVVLSGRIELKPGDASQEAFDEMERVAVDLLEALRETPLSGRGINVAYDTDITERLDRVLAATELELQKHRIAATRVAWRLAGDSPDTINLTVHRDAGSPSCRLDFNHHRDVSSAREAIEHVRGYMGEAVSLSATIARDALGCSEDGS